MWASITKGPSGFDRKKDLIKYKEYHVATAELEGLLLQRPLVCDAAVAGLYDERVASEVPRAFAVLHYPGVPHGDFTNKENVASTVRLWVDERVSLHKRLRDRMYVVDSVPKPPSGKALRRLMRYWSVSKPQPKL